MEQRDDDEALNTCDNIRRRYFSIPELETVLWAKA